MACQEIEGGGEDTLAEVSYPPPCLVEEAELKTNFTSIQ